MPPHQSRTPTRPAPVDEAEDLTDAAVRVQVGHVEADHQGLTAGRAEVPGEAGLLVVAVDRAAGREDETRELRLP
jgi:hypothetical protein